MPSDLHSGIHAQKMIYSLGMNDKPTVLDDADFEDYAKQNNATIYYRGVKGNTNISADDIFEQMRYSDTTHIGGGFFGDGLYFSKIYDDARGYAHGNYIGKDQAVSKMILKPGAKIISQAELYKEKSKLTYEQQRSLNRAGKKSTWDNAGEAQLAMKLGYDGLEGGADHHVIILNRGAVILSNKNVPRGTESNKDGSPKYN